MPRAWVKRAQAAYSDQDRKRFVVKYRREMAAAGPRALFDVLAAWSHQADFSVGCYCAEESRCHRAVLRRLLIERGARVT
jgi:uncharacterized protein YeaO (DUF488 family)